MKPPKDTNWNWIPRKYSPITGRAYNGIVYNGSKRILYYTASTKQWSICTVNDAQAKSIRNTHGQLELPDGDAWCSEPPIPTVFIDANHDSSFYTKFTFNKDNTLRVCFDDRHEHDYALEYLNIELELKSLKTKYEWLKKENEDLTIKLKEAWKRFYALVMRNE